jgi:hypothetical protein
VKKNEVKKLRLSRETLQTLQDSDSRKVMGGTDDQSGEFSCMSAWREPCMCTSDTW